jgi:hypothetical protein
MKHIAILILIMSVALSAQGIVEKSTDLATRPILTGEQAGVPATRGPFQFPAPYGTQGYRLTEPSDCPASRPDCVSPVGYANWPQINNSAGSEIAYAFVSLRDAGGPTLFSINKVTNAVTKLGPMFTGTDVRGVQSGEGWYFSHTMPTKLYVTPSSVTRQLQRVDILTGQTDVVFDIGAEFGTNRYIWQLTSSNTDLVHSFTLRDRANYRMLGCGVYFETSQTFKHYPDARIDECHVDRSGRWLVIKSQVDGLQSLDNRFINLETDEETLLTDPEGATGHSDMGYGVMIGHDNYTHAEFGNFPSIRLWAFGTNPPGPGSLIYHPLRWGLGSVNHISLNHAKDIPLEQQYMCGSDTGRTNGPRKNEVVCFRLDGSLGVLTLAPTMTTLPSTSAGGQIYNQLPKGNLDPTGEYFTWSTNLGTTRTDVIVVRVPWAGRLPGGTR